MSKLEKRDRTAYYPDSQEFDKLFCRLCRRYGKCPGGGEEMLTCRALIDWGLWDRFCRKDYNYGL